VTRHRWLRLFGRIVGCFGHWLSESPEGTALGLDVIAAPRYERDSRGVAVRSLWCTRQMRTPMATRDRSCALAESSLWRRAGDDETACSTQSAPW